MTGKCFAPYIPYQLYPAAPEPQSYAPLSLEVSYRQVVSQTILCVTGTYRAPPPSITIGRN